MTGGFRSRCQSSAGVGDGLSAGSVEGERDASLAAAASEHCERVQAILDTATVPTELAESAESVCGQGDVDAGS